MAKNRQEKPMTGKEEVAERKTTAVGEPLPDWMKGQAGAGLKHLDETAFTVPRLKLLQQLSPEITERDNLKPGQFWHTIAEQGLGKELLVTPIYVSQAAILWRPREDGGGILARAMDNKLWVPGQGEFTVKLKGGQTVTWKIKSHKVKDSGLLDWGSSNPSDPQSQPAATAMINVALHLVDRPDLSPVVVTFQRSAIKQGRNFVGKLAISQAPMYGRVFKMSSFEDMNRASQKFMNVRLEGIGLVQKEAQFNSNKDMHEMFAKRGLDVRDLEGMQDEDEQPVEGAGGEPATSPGGQKY